METTITIVVCAMIVWFGSMTGVIVAFYLGVKSQTPLPSPPVEVSLEEGEERGGMDELDLMEEGVDHWRVGG